MCTLGNKSEYTPYNFELLSMNYYRMNYYRSVLGTLDGGKPQDKFFGFHKCVSGVTGEVIANDMLTQLADWQLCRSKVISWPSLCKNR